MDHLTGHQLGRRLLDLPDHVLLTVDGDFITEANASTYDDDKQLDLPCINLETSSELWHSPIASGSPSRTR